MYIEFIFLYLLIIMVTKERKVNVPFLCCPYFFNNQTLIIVVNNYTNWWCLSLLVIRFYVCIKFVIDLHSAFYRLTDYKIKLLLRNFLPIAPSYILRKGVLCFLSRLNGHFISCPSTKLITIIKTEYYGKIFTNNKYKI